MSNISRVSKRSICPNDIATGDAKTAYPEYPAPEKSPGIYWYCAISGDQYEEAAGQAGEEKAGDRTL